MRASIFQEKNFTKVVIPHPVTPPEGQFPSGPYVESPVHCGVQYRAAGFKGSKVWISNSPFPDDDYENPCVWHSNDTEYPAVNFTPFAKNPIIGKPGDPSSLSYNADPDILIANDELYVINREHWRGTDVPSPAEQRLETYVFKGIFEGNTLVDFTEKIKLFDGYGTAYTGTNIANYASPSLIHNGSKFLMIYLVTGSWNSASEDQNCKRIRINEAVTLTENCFQTGWQDISFSGFKIEPWHMQCFYHAGKLYAIVCATIRGYNGMDSGRIYLGEFDADLKNLYIHGRALTDFRAYRCAAYVDENGLFVLYANTYGYKLNVSVPDPAAKLLYVTHSPFSEVLDKVKS